MPQIPVTMVIGEGGVADKVRAVLSGMDPVPLSMSRAEEDVDPLGRDVEVLVVAPESLGLVCEMVASRSVDGLPRPAILTICRATSNPAFPPPTTATSLPANNGPSHIAQ